KKSRRILLSTPWTFQPIRSKNAAASDPISPLLPVINMDLFINAVPCPGHSSFRWPNRISERPVAFLPRECPTATDRGEAGCFRLPVQRRNQGGRAPRLPRAAPLQQSGVRSWRRSLQVLDRKAP